MQPHCRERARPHEAKPYASTLAPYRFTCLDLPLKKGIPVILSCLNPIDPRIYPSRRPDPKAAVTASR